MPTQCSRDLFGYEAVEGRQVVAAFDGGEHTTEGGALLLGATDRAINLVGRFAACFVDGRAQAQVEHTVKAMVAQRVFGIALRYEDLIDHDQLRHDPVLATLAGKLTARRKDCAPLAGKSTLNRLEHAPLGPRRYHKIGHDPAAIEDLFVALFLEAHTAPPDQIILDLDATDDPLHGHQEGRFFHGYGACPPAAQGPTGGTATAICRCTCSAAGTCSPPSSGGQTSMRPPAPRTKQLASSAGSVPDGRGSRSCCAPIRALPGTS
jgi:Transposase DDE domain group 1